jgi:histidinol-phosphate/aromatic aminotransferase/cobyric acid decarboxylase-like protein/choline kinase
MQAIILTAGFGSRMKPYSIDTHKTLLKVAGKTVLERIIDGLIENNVDDIYIVTGYRSKDIEDYIDTNYSEKNIKFVHNELYDCTNNVYSLHLALDSISKADDVLIIESDLIYEPKVISTIINSPYPNAALLDKFKKGMDGTVVSICDDLITNVIPPHLQGANFDFSDKYKTLNIYKLSKSFIESSFKNLIKLYATSINNNSYYELVLGILVYVQKEQIHAVVLNGEKWTEIDDPNDFFLAEFIFNDEKKLEILNESFGEYWKYNITDFSFIRNMHFPTPSLISDIKGTLEELMFNYGSKQNVLDTKMSYFAECSPKNIIALNGASQVYPIIKNYFKSKTSLIPTPSFGEYLRIFPNSNKYEDSLEWGITLKEEDIKKSDIIVIVSPNNPTANIVQSDYILRLVSTYPDKFFIIDESFIEFSKEESVISSLERLKLANALVIKSLSKNLGVPGLRIGYVFSLNADLVNYIRSNVPIWNMNSLAELYVELMLKNKAVLKKSYDKTIEDREELRALLQSNPFVSHVYKSAANFILIRMDDLPSSNSEVFVKFLLKKYSILIKDVSNRFNDSSSYFRIAVRLPSENKALSDAIASYFSTGSSHEN